MLEVLLGELLEHEELLGVGELLDDEELVLGLEEGAVGLAAVGVPVFGGEEGGDELVEGDLAAPPECLELDGEVVEDFEFLLEVEAVGEEVMF